MLQVTRKAILFSIALFLFFPFIAISSPIEIKATYDPDTKTITYNGEVFIPELIKNQALVVEPPSEPTLTVAEFWLDLLIVIFLTLFAGAMSGLTVGYLSIDDLVLELKLSTGTEEEKTLAKKILPIISNHHWLLVTLLVCNSFAMEAMPIVLNKLVNEMMAIVISVTLVLFFGEIIPQALCTGPNQMKIASGLAPVTYFLMYLTYPISYPLAILIDHVVGKHMKNRFCNSDLRGLIELHTKEQIQKIQEEEKEFMGDDMGLSKEQANFMLGALDIQEKKARDIMIPLSKTVMLNNEDEIDEKMINIFKIGHSRIPVYSKTKDNIQGILRIKILIGVDFSQNKSLKELNIPLSQPIVISPEMMAIDLLNEFRKGKSHMAFVTKDVEKMQKKFGLNKQNSFSESLLLSALKTETKTKLNLLGIITLEDVIEKMIKIDILDEDDYRKKKMKRDSFRGRDNFKRAFTNKICQSFIEEKKDQINSLLGQDMLGGSSNQKNYFEMAPEPEYTLLNNKEEKI